jgi:hypothetical protein
VVGGGWPLLELHRDKATLEEIFIELTRGEGPAGGEPAAAADSA